MKVKDLIEILLELPDNAEVCVPDDPFEGKLSNVEKVELDEEYNAVILYDRYNIDQ